MANPPPLLTELEYLVGRLPWMQARELTHDGRSILSVRVPNSATLEQQASIYEAIEKLGFHPTTNWRGSLRYIDLNLNAAEIAKLDAYRLSAQEWIEAGGGFQLNTRLPSYYQAVNSLEGPEALAINLSTKELLQRHGVPAMLNKSGQIVVQYDHKAALLSAREAIRNIPTVALPPESAPVSNAVRGVQESSTHKKIMPILKGVSGAVAVAPLIYETLKIGQEELNANQPPWGAAAHLTEGAGAAVTAVSVGASFVGMGVTPAVAAGVFIDQSYRQGVAWTHYGYQVWHDNAVAESNERKLTKLLGSEEKYADFKNSVAACAIENNKNPDDAVKAATQLALDQFEQARRQSMIAKDDLPPIHEYTK